MREKNNIKNFIEREVERSNFKFDIKGIAKEGNYEFSIQAEDLNGTLLQSRWLPFTIRIDGQGGGSLIERIFKGGFYGFIIVSLLLIALLVAARWSERAFNILMDPLVQKINIYFKLAPAIRH